jgi:hypothetical protein
MALVAAAAIPFSHGSRQDLLLLLTAGVDVADE